jgi:predicted lipid-binding transport protein (Tim44 family)
MSPGSTVPREGAPMDVIPREGANPTDGAPTATCAGCGAPLAADQRYCLACGRPCSPVRLAFLDVLQSEHQTVGMPVLGGPQTAGYQLPPDPPGLLGSLRRYSGLFGLLGVLLASLLIGLLVGHWITVGGSPGKQVVEVKGLNGPLAAAPSSGTSAGSGSSTGSSSSGHGSSGGSGSSTGSSSSSSKSQSAPKSEKAEEAADAKEVTTTKALPAAHKTSASKLEKLAHTTGKQHAKEVAAALGNGPIETGSH